MSTKVTSLDQNTFNKLRKLYIIALSAIAVSVILSQILVRKYLRDQQDDAKIINIAGRQRMLSQKLTKEVLLYTNANLTTNKGEVLDNIKSTLQLWESSHQSLQNGNDSLQIEGNNSEAIQLMFKELQPSFTKIQTSVKNILQESSIDAAIFKKQIQQETANLRIQEQQFLTIMDRIVNQYDKEATLKVEKLQKLEFILLIVTLAILLAEFLFIFWPAAKRTKQTIKNLLVSEEKAKEMEKKIRKLKRRKLKLRKQRK